MFRRSGHRFVASGRYSSLRQIAVTAVTILRIPRSFAGQRLQYRLQSVSRGIDAFWLGLHTGISEWNTQPSPSPRATGDGSLSARFASGIAAVAVCVAPVDFSLAMRHQHVILGNADLVLQPPSGLDVRGERRLGRPDYGQLGEAAWQRRTQVRHRLVMSARDGYGYSSLRTNFLCGFQICKPCRSIT